MGRSKSGKQAAEIRMQRSFCDGHHPLTLPWRTYSTFTCSKTPTEPLTGLFSFVCNRCVTLTHLCVSDNTPARLYNTSLPRLTLIWTQNVLSTAVSSYSEGTYTVTSPPPRGFLPMELPGSATVKSRWKGLGFVLWEGEKVNTFLR